MNSVGRANAALTALDAKGAEIASLQQQFIEGTTDKVLSWEVQRRWLQAAQQALHSAGVPLKIPPELMKKSCDRAVLHDVVEKSMNMEGKLWQKFGQRLDRVKQQVHGEIAK